MQLRLRVRDTVPINGPVSTSILLPHKCDGKGNLYYRPASPIGNLLAAPVVRVSPDGEEARVFRLGETPGFPADAAINEFAIDLRGKLYLLAFRQEQQKQDAQAAQDFDQVIVVYDSDGSYDSTIKLELLFDPGQFAVFPSGEFFVSGIQIDQDNQPFTAILDERGRLIKEISLPEDIQEKQEPKESPATVAGQADESVPTQGEAAQAGNELPQEEFEKAISLGNAAAAEDGNVYLMRATPDPIIYVVAPSGDVVRRLVIPRPSENARPNSTFHVAAGKLTIVLAEIDSSRALRGHVIVEANAETGEVLAHYSLPPELGGALACYTPNGFTFLGRDRGQLVIKHASPY